MAENNKGQIKADSLQQLHALHNLAVLLGPGQALPQGVAPTLRDGRLQADADEIRKVLCLPLPVPCEQELGRSHGRSAWKNSCPALRQGWRMAQAHFLHCHRSR